MNWQIKMTRKKSTQQSGPSKRIDGSTEWQERERVSATESRKKCNNNATKWPRAQKQNNNDNNNQILFAIILRDYECSFSSDALKYACCVRNLLVSILHFFFVFSVMLGAIAAAVCRCRLHRSRRQLTATDATQRWNTQHATHSVQKKKSHFSSFALVF